ncbi:MAG: GAF domain-containing protein [Alphaproteobacteria bacterium]|nr:GAF domain-containing protein [Alphaproteobacteria bacterium]MBU0801943.1 GAF domain-containing protein [Alphaproteobacteria bacterium]MBU0873692.1 GAF domain-containing protein [Alphaproteobacteria bacterium]MBU1403078.1 GAF domain-containing protein [Alphaproteobacteria bacterium]MBU1593819.1 GAF domain-containing protein [Alphaproteobacteria bacterium]
MSEPLTDLTNCDREPIHIPGSIQPHGALLACDGNAVAVLRHSENAAAMLGIDGEIENRQLSDLVGDSIAHDLRNALTTAADATRPALLFDLKLPGGGIFNVAAHRHKGTAIIEFEPAGMQGRPLQLARNLIGRVRGIDSVDRLIAQSARLLRGLLGYDRVMIYRFEADGAGKVVSESRREDLESFLGQYFPASDIPRQARELYLQNTIRIIGDASAQRVPIRPVLDKAGEPLDLSFAHLRSVSPVHLEYLRNMGVAASMSISVIVDGKLWGLIACHHYQLRTLPMAERVAAEMFGEFFSLQLNGLKQKRKLDTAFEARRALERFMRLTSHHANVQELLTESLSEFAGLMPCDGVGVWVDGSWNGQGFVPPPVEMPALMQVVGARAAGQIWSTHALAKEHPGAEAYADQVSGVLAIPLSQTSRDFLLFFRREMVQTLDWAGNPEKSYSTGPLGDRLTPRTSFAIWKEIVHRQAQPWDEADLETAEAARGAIVEIVLRHNELLSDERAKADMRQRVLNDELNHRVKNILAVIKSLVGHPVKEGRSLTDYVTALKGRIQALALAHDQVVRGDGGGMLAELIGAEVMPYRGGQRSITIDGPAVRLDSRAFSVMALVLHELATNAAKYGALSADAGRLVIEWRLDTAGDCTIDWIESGGPPVKAPSRRGLGSTLIDRSIPYDLAGSSSVEFPVEGARARMVLPAKHVIIDERAFGQADPAAKPADGQATQLADPLVLLVEDQMLIAMDAEETLADYGAGRVIVASSSAQALAKLAGASPDIAVLDVNLGHETSIPVARELVRRNIPFVFASGYGDTVMLPEEFRSVPLVRKPYDGETLVPVMAELLKPQA